MTSVSENKEKLKNIAVSAQGDAVRLADGYEKCHQAMEKINRARSDSTLSFARQREVCNCFQELVEIGIPVRNVINRISLMIGCIKTLIRETEPEGEPSAYTDKVKKVADEYEGIKIAAEKIAFSTPIIDAFLAVLERPKSKSKSKSKSKHTLNKIE